MQRRRYDRIMAGQNHKSDATWGANLHGPNQDFRRSHIMILSCHDSVDPPYSSGSLDKGEMRPLPTASTTLYFAQVGLRSIRRERAALMQARIWKKRTIDRLA